MTQEVVAVVEDAVEQIHRLHDTGRRTTVGLVE